MSAEVPAAPVEERLAGRAGCNPVCHACTHRDYTAGRSLAQKHAYLSRVLAPWAERLAPVAGPTPDRRLGYRDRVTLRSRWQDGAWSFGLVRRDEFIAIPDCPVHTERVRALCRWLAETLPPAGEFPLGWLHVAGAQATLVVQAHGVATASLAARAPGLAALGIEGLWLNSNPSAGRKLFLKTGWRHLWGTSRSRDAAGLLHGPGSFQQLLPELYDEALEQAVAFGLADGRPVLDLCCGHGASLRRWRRAGVAVLGIDVSREAVGCARDNAPGATVLAGRCATRLPQVRAWWSGQASTPDAWVNPDRSGLEEDVAVALATALRPGRIAYLSCSAGTLARDLRHFAAAGYSVERLQPYDFFPQTRHVEVLALLSR